MGLLDSVDFISCDEVDNQDKLMMVAKLSNGDWNWYVIAGDRLDGGDVYCFGFVEGFVDELGFFMLSEIESVGAELVSDWVPREFSF